MSASQRRKGNGYERDLVAWLRDHGRPHIERRLAGGPGDRGDLTGWPGVVVEAKNHRQLDLAGWVDQLEVEIEAANAMTGVVVVKRRLVTDVGKHYAICTVERWEALMKAAGW